MSGTSNMLQSASEKRSFDDIRLRLLAAGLLGSADQGSSLVLTSRRQGDGVSTVVAGLAGAAGAAWPNQVLVLDVDESRKRVSTLLNPNIVPISINETLQERASIDGATVADDELGIRILALKDSAGASAEEVRALLKTLSERYRIVLVDVGAMFGPGAASWLSCDANAIMVVDTTSTTVPALQRVRTEIDQSNFELNGFILNRRRFPIPSFLYRWLT